MRWSWPRWCFIELRPNRLQVVAGKPGRGRRSDATAELICAGGMTEVVLAELAILVSAWRINTGAEMQLVFFNRQNPIRSSPSISISPNANKSFDVPSLISNRTTFDSSSPSDPPPLPPPPPDRFGIVDRNGRCRTNSMSAD
ncbi:hypothetical protein CKAN_01027300 [Cinnamomum micranthum f. kanehirae]|uniref:Uncharacterized protein n=1 Tax=Cinnamomum micranthum f. kanehirae TaxID=337451 RepID=A0A443NSU1_9MAGN|nr:hypothetical protein CKAN_01027300 [Cinnamomum micranthum f. kanehirae]